MAWYDDLKTPRIKKQVSIKNSRVPDGVWSKCSQCGEMIQSRLLKENFNVCPLCDYHSRLTAEERILSLRDDDAPIEEWDPDLVSTDPLHFVEQGSYRDRLRASAEKTGMKDSVATVKTRLNGIAFHLGVFDFSFMGGSMGTVAGEKIARVFERASADGIPAVTVTASGGARMQEGILSLLQMAKTTALRQELAEKGIPYISILTDPTTGGVAASFSMLGDVILAEPKALIGFAGPRVIQQTIRQTLPPGFQRSEFLLQHGFVDRVVHRRDLKKEVGEWLVRLSPNSH